MRAPAPDLPQSLNVPGPRQSVQSSGTRPSVLSVDHEPVAFRLNDTLNSSILGKCTRNPMTGQAVLKNATIMTDFSIIDLWERSALYGTPDDLVQDPYVFKIVPLPLRTWIYHTYFGSDLVSKLSGDSGVMDMVLKSKVIDVELSAGRWSPVIVLTPAAFVSVFTMDFLTAFVCILMSIFNVTASILTNDPAYYRKSRLFTILPRFMFFIFIWVRCLQRSSEGSIVTLSYIVIILLCSVDFFLGDIRAAIGIGSACHYEVMKVLPNRIFVCRKNGAAFLEDESSRREISQIVTGMGYFDGLALIAEIRGLVVQLKCLSREDWQHVLEEKAETGRPISFIGLDVFNSTRTSLKELEHSQEVASRREEEDKARKHLLS